MLLLTPIVFASHMGPSRRARKKAAATRLWQQQEKMLNDQLAEEENKMNSQFRESKYNQKMVHAFGVPKSATYSRSGMMGHMDLIREE